MYFDLQLILISVVTYWLRLNPIDAYIKKIKFFKYETALFNEYPQQPYYTHSFSFASSNWLNP